MKSIACIRKLLIFNLLVCFLMLDFNCSNSPTISTNPLDSIEIQASSRSIYSGGFVQFKALAKNTDGSTNDVSNEASWSTSPGTAGTINENGLFSATNDSVGIETIQTNYGGFTASFQLEVTKRAMVLSVWPFSAKVQAGETFKFEAIAEYQDATVQYITEKVDWSLSPGLRATIDSTGTFQANQNTSGTETVICDYQTLRSVSQVEIKPKIELPFEMVTIPAGSFIMGNENGRADEKPEHEVYIDEFQIGKYEVTFGQYADYLNQAFDAGEIIIQYGAIIAKKGPYIWYPYGLLAGDPTSPDVYIEYDDSDRAEIPFRPSSGSENQPVVRLTWYGAAAFCAFYGLRLPTEAQWEKAARGGLQLEYATRDGTLNHDLANYEGTDGLDTFESLAPVGTFPPNPFGLFDMTGNAGEYVFDIYQWNYYTVSPADNPTGPGPEIFTGKLPGSAVWRGGSWIFNENNCRTTSRFASESTQNDLNFLAGSVIGFRVARSVP